MSYDHEAFWSARYRDAGQYCRFGTAPNAFLSAQAGRFAAWELLELCEHEDVMAEGRGHAGHAALIDLVVRKPLRCG